MYIALLIIHALTNLDVCLTFKQQSLVRGWKKYISSEILHLWPISKIWPMRPVSLYKFQKFGGRGAVAMLIEASLLQNFWVHGEPCWLADMALCTKLH